MYLKLQAQQKYYLKLFSNILRADATQTTRKADMTDRIA